MVAASPVKEAMLFSQSQSSEEGPDLSWCPLGQVRVLHGFWFWVFREKGFEGSELSSLESCKGQEHMVGSCPFKGGQDLVVGFSAHHAPSPVPFPSVFSLFLVMLFTKCITGQQACLDSTGVN